MDTSRKLVDPPVGKDDSAVPAKTLDYVQIVELHWIKRVAVKRTDVVTLQKAFGKNFPVRVDFDFSGAT